MSGYPDNTVDERCSGFGKRCEIRSHVGSVSREFEGSARALSSYVRHAEVNDVFVTFHST
jgi:hypothetical protein